VAGFLGPSQIKRSSCHHCSGRPDGSPPLQAISVASSSFIIDDTDTDALPQMQCILGRSLRLGKAEEEGGRAEKKANATALDEDKDTISYPNEGMKCGMENK